MIDEQENGTADNYPSESPPDGDVSGVGDQLPPVTEPPVVEQASASLPSIPPKAWFHCHLRGNTGRHILAVDAAEAKVNYKRSVGVIDSVHPVHVGEKPGYVPTEQDIELAKQLAAAN